MAATKVDGYLTASGKFFQDKTMADYVEASELLEETFSAWEGRMPIEFSNYDKFKEMLINNDELVINFLRASKAHSKFLNQFKE